MKLPHIKPIFLSSLLLFTSLNIFSQDSKSKPPVNFSAIDSWPSIGGIEINNNGSYCGHLISSQESVGSILTLVSTRKNWSSKLSGIRSYAFSSDNKSVFFLKNDTLGLMKLGDKLESYHNGVESFKLLQYQNQEYLLITNKNKSLIIINRTRKKEIVIEGVESYFQNKNKNQVFFKRTERDLKSITRLELATFEMSPSVQGFSFENIVASDAGDAFAFLERGEIWYYKFPMEKPKRFFDQNALPKDLIISGLERFSQDSENLFFYLQEVSPLPSSEGSVMVDIWSSTDARLQSQQLHDLKPHRFLASVNIQTGHVTQLQHEFETLFMLDRSRVDNLGVLRYNKGNDGEANWNPSGRYRNYVIDCLTGQKEQMNFLPIYLSPNGKNILGVDSSTTNFVSYNRDSKITKQITASVLPDEKALYYSIYDRRRFEFQGWINNSQLIVNDDYDLWLLDLENDTAPINLTNGYGRKHHISFRITKDSYADTILKEEDWKILTAFDNNSKQNGFFRLSGRVGDNPVKLFMGDYYFDFPTSPHLYSHFPTKAKDANLWIVQYEQSNSATNIYVTKDFTKFKAVSDFHPEKKYNWLTTQLVSYTSLTGEMLQGILYKPENFDSTKRYPVILFYYEKLSNKLNSFQLPDYTSNNINIPYFVSKGYLVFSPDITFSVGKPGESAYNAVIGAANLLATYHWINPKKMGLYGHSFAGGLTNYILTKTDRFAAAVSSAGHSDLISAAGSITLRDGTPADRTWIETDQGRIGSTIWDNPEIYIENSPVFHVDKINTPVLMTNNVLDESTNFSQGLEFFTSLRRLNKKAWMLQYDGETHGLVKLENMRDYTIRVNQFFDYYLMDKPAPIWMTRGIPAKFKGINNGLSLDTLFKNN